MIVAIILLFNNANSQNIRHVTLFPQNYNSAFAGINKCKNISLTNNFHYITTRQYFYSNSLLFDGYFNKISGSLLFKINNLSSSDKIFTTQSLDIAYSYHIKLNRKYMLSAAVGTKIISENFNNNLLIFPQMLDLWSNTILPNTENIPAYKSKTINFNSGLVFWSKKCYLSTSVNNFFPVNIHEPQTNIVLFTVFFERKYFKINSDILYKINSAFFYSQFKVEAYNGIMFDILDFRLGLLSKQSFIYNNLSNGILFTVGVNFNIIIIDYSYEFFYSGFYAPLSSNSEISLKFILNCSENNNNNTIKCPAY